MLERLLMRKDMRLGNIQQKLMIQEKALARLEKKVAEHESLLLFRQGAMLFCCSCSNTSTLLSAQR